MTSVKVCTQSGDSELVTKETFRAWKRRNGRHAAFVLNAPVEHFVGTYADMQGLPAGEFDASLVKRCAPPEQVCKQLRGHDLWKCC